MKLLCIERDAFSPPMLRVGEVYTHESTYTCICGRAYYSVVEIPPSQTEVGGQCHFCKTLAPREVHNRFHFQRRRFVPWNPDALNITLREVYELYKSAPKVKA